MKIFSDFQRIFLQTYIVHLGTCYEDKNLGLLQRVKEKSTNKTKFLWNIIELSRPLYVAVDVVCSSNFLESIKSYFG